MSAPSTSFENNTKPGGVADRPDECAALQQTGAMGQQEPHEVQQREIPSPAPGEEHPHAPSNVGD